MFKSIIVGYDGSDPSVRALELACRLSSIHQAELHIVHTPEVSMTEFPGEKSVSIAAQKAMQDAVEIAKTLNVTPASQTIGEAQPSEDIMQIVGLYDGDLIVTGRRGLGSVTGLFMGSTSQKLAHMAKCACMTVA